MTLIQSGQECRVQLPSVSQPTRYPPDLIMTFYPSQIQVGTRIRIIINCIVLKKYNYSIYSMQYIHDYSSSKQLYYFIQL